MTDASAIARPSQLWKSLPPERKLQAAEAFWCDGEAGLEQAEAIALIAQQIKFRAKSVVAMPADKKARHLASFPDVSELVAARLLVAYHLAHQRPMMGAFLDALGIAHDNGMIADEEVKAPEPDALRKAATTIAGQFPADDVALYLSTLLWQDPETWGALAGARPQPSGQRPRSESAEPACSCRLEHARSDWVSTVDGWVALFTLTALEIVLGIDNVVFISILAGKLPPEQRERARKLGMFLAMFIRILLLLSITWVMGLTDAARSRVWTRGLTGRDLILIVGGLFLIAKSTHEIHIKLEGDEHEGDGTARGRRLPASSRRSCCSTSCSRSTR